jgi:hypothetical protein
MNIIGIEKMDRQQLTYELDRGGRFVIYEYCISIFIMTFKRPSNIYFIRAGESAIVTGLVFSLISFLCGWWGIPWGPIWTIGSLINNFGGGKDVTQSVMADCSLFENK